MKSKLLPLVLLASSTLVSGAENTSLIDQVSNNYQSARVRTEYNHINEVDTLRTTIGAAPSITNYKDWHGSVASIFETFRLNHDKNFDNNSDQVSLGTTLPLKLGEIKTSTLLFGNFGDKSGFGLEETLTLGNISPSISYEKNFDNDQERIGGEIEYRSGKFTSAIGFDNISVPNKKDINQILARSTYSVNKVDALGLALTHKDYGNKIENSTLGFWAHSGKESPFSARAVYQFSSDSEGKDFHFGQFIFIPSAGAFTGKGGAEYFADRRASRGDEPFSMNITPLSVSAIQPVPVMDRTTKGLAFLLSGKHTSTRVNTSDSFTSAVGYTGKLGNGKYLSGIIDYTFSDNQLLRQESLSPRIRLDLGNFEIGARYSIPLNSQTKPAVLFEAQYNF